MTTNDIVIDPSLMEVRANITLRRLYPKGKSFEYALNRRLVGLTTRMDTMVTKKKMLIIARSVSGGQPVSLSLC